MSEISSRNDPTAGLNFILDVQGMLAGFAEVGGLTSDTDIVEYREGNEDITIGRLPRVQKHVNVVLKRGFTRSKDLWQWRKKVIEAQIQRLNGTITLLDESRHPAIVWKFFEAWPCKWIGPPINDQDSLIAIEEMVVAVERLELD
jgi:phage tail-like protein